MARMVLSAAVSFAVRRARITDAMPIDAMMPMIAMTISNSISVNPASPFGPFTTLLCGSHRAVAWQPRLALTESAPCDLALDRHLHKGKPDTNCPGSEAEDR